ncbi:MAG: ilvG [Proteobacteria bacterium]|nr:ilvG [Pseudomonadota bacterium]RPJ47275.1 MAG: thiamine pyrophosphate-binding protein [Betaproteobacteria bacterium]
MTAKSGTRPLLQTGAQILVDSLITHGANLAFGVPGESYLAVLDAIYEREDEFRFIICRQEGGVTNMADAYGKLTGQPGIAFVTRGPGATNASIGVHTAFQDSTPLILFVGQVGNDVVEREAFQEIDFRRMFGPMTKWVAQIDRADRVAEYVSHAFHVATAGRPGPVVLALPEDMQTEMAPPSNAGRYQRVAANPGEFDMHKLRDLLGKAKRPFMMVGGGGWNRQACDDMLAFARAFNLPVGASFRCQDLIDNRDPHYVGDVSVGMNPKLAERIRNSDLLLVVGARLGEWTTANYTLVEIPRPAQKMVHVHAGAEELGRVYQADVLINSGMPEFAAAARKLAPVKPSWDAWTREARAELEAWQQPVKVPGKVNMSEVIAFLRTRLPPETIVTNGAGNFAIWVHRFYPYTGFRTQLGPTSGAMGYGVPSGVAAKIVHPERPVVSFSGDGCFLMNGQELATAAQYDVKVLFIVVNNSMYGTIRMHQERNYPERVSGTQLKNPDFAALARAYGLHGETVEATADFAAAFERAWAAKTSALIEVRVDPDAITPRTTLSAIRAEAKKSGNK